MIATALDVERHQIQTESLAFLFEKVIGHLFREIVVEFLHGLSGEADEELVQIARRVDHLRLEKVLAEEDHGLLLPPVVDQTAKSNPF